MTEQEIYAKCLSLGMTPAGAAGCTANIMAESAGRSDNLQDCYNNSFGVSDAEYVRQVDAGTRNFADSAGFGYCQWTSNDRKRNLFDYLKGKGKSIADSDGQFQFMGREMRQSYAYVWNILTTTADPFEAGYVMCKRYEIPANTEAQSQYRGNEAKKIYQRCAGTTPAVEPSDGGEKKDDSSSAAVFWPPRMVDKNMSGPDVTVLQAILVARGHTVAVVSGVFGESTDKAVRQFQRDHMLTPDGVVGPLTWNALLKR